VGRVDEILGAGGAMLVTLPVWLAVQNDGSLSGGWLVFLIIMAVPGAGVMLLGLKKRRRTLRVVRVWDHLEEHHDVPVERLLELGSFQEDELIDVLARVNRVTSQAYLLDEARNAVIDSRLRGRAVVVERCAGCGAPVNLSVEVGRVDDVSCPSCGAPVAGSARQLLDRAFAEVTQLEPAEGPNFAKDAGRAGTSGGLGQFGRGLAGCVALPFILLFLSFGLALAPPLIGALVIWELLRYRFAPRTDTGMAAARDHG
jgi:hypothetical protein